MFAQLGLPVLLLPEAFGKARARGQLFISQIFDVRGSAQVSLQGSWAAGVDVRMEAA